MSAFSPSPRLPTGPPPAAALHGQRTSGEPTVPLSIERREYAPRSLPIDGTPRDGPASSASRWHRWQDSASRGPRAAATPSPYAPAGSVTRAADGATEKELEETRRILFAYKAYVENNVLKEVGTLEATLADTQKSLQRCRAEKERLEAELLRAREGRGKGTVVYSASDGDGDSEHGARSARRGGSTDALQQQRTIEQLRRQRDADAARLQELQVELAAVRAERVEPRDGRASSPAVSAEPALLAVQQNLRHMVTDGKQFSVALCQLADSVRSKDTTSTVRAVSRAFVTVAATWRGVDEDAALVEERFGRSATSASDPAPLLAALMNAQMQEHMRVTEVVQTLLTSTVSVAAQLHDAKERVHQLRSDFSTRTAELEEDHQSEVSALHQSIRELETRVAAASSTPAGQPPGSGLLSNASPGVNGGGAGVWGESGQSDGGEASPPGCAAGALKLSGTAGASPEKTEADTQTPLSMEFITAALTRGAARAQDSVPASPNVMSPSTGGRGTFQKATRRERDSELVELLVAEVEKLREEVAVVQAERNVLQEQRVRFLGQVEVPYLEYRRRLALAGYLGNHTLS